MRTFLVLPFLLGCASQGTTHPGAWIEAEVKEILSAQEAAWNRGDIEGFMQGYDRSADLTFAAAGRVTKGWQETLDRYRKNYDTPEKMGRLRFEDLKVYPIAADAALLLGRWTLEGPPKRPTGLFTLLFRKKPEGWRIVLDHTSSAP